MQPNHALTFLLLQSMPRWLQQQKQQQPRFSTGGNHSAECLLYPSSDSAIVRSKADI